MAGNCRPNDNILIGSKVEMTDYEIGSYHAYYTNSPYGLFNGHCENEFQTPNTFYWISNEIYFIITLKEPVNIYRSGTGSWSLRCDPLTILKRNNKTSVFEDITSKIKQNCSPIANGQWELYIKNLPAGEYKFQGKSTGNLRIDSEWFLETVYSMLLKSNNQYYSIKDEYYNTEAKIYLPIEELNFDAQLFSLSNLFKEVTVNGEIFRPIDKFDNFQIVQQSNIPIKVLGCKSKSELIVANNDIDTSRVSTIHSFNSLQNTSENGDVKIVLSIDKGKTWNSYDTKSLSLVPLDITIPLLPYSILSEDEKENWKNAKDTIQTCGIPANIFHSIDFNNLTEQLNNIRFAYVISKEAYQDTAELDQLSWSFDAKGFMRKMVNNEFNVHTYINKIIVEPLVNTQILKTNILI